MYSMASSFKITSSEEYISSKAKEIGVNYVSSSEKPWRKLRKSNMKLIFGFLDEQFIEPYTKQTYGAILNDLKYVKDFASGILVPKSYIWPLNKNQYLQLATDLVKDAHTLGLEVYASGFANYVLSSYNYSYDPSAEYLQFIDNSDFSVDGVLAHFPSAASAAIACLAHTKDKPLPPLGTNLVSPYSQQGLKRNPAAKNSGKLMTSSDFLAFSKRSNVSSILIDIHVNNASYLAARGISIVDAVSSALFNASDDETRQQVLIMSDDSAVLGAFKKFPAFKRVLQIGHRISNASKPSVEELAKFTDAVLVNRGSVVQAQGSFLLRFTGVIEKMHAVNLSVYVETLKNEFMNLGLDFLADPTVEVTTYSSLMADGIVTEFPATTAAYFKSPCSDFSQHLTYIILPARHGVSTCERVFAPPGRPRRQSLPPVQGPAPVLEPAVVDPPLPSVNIGGTPAPASSNSSNTTSGATAAGAGICLLVAGLAALLSLSSH